MKTKNCSVILKRLDEKLLNQYVQKYSLRITANVGSIESTEKLKCGYLETRKRPKKVKKNENSVESITKDELKRKKRKIKPLYYTDDEDCSNEPITEKKFRTISHVEDEEATTCCPRQLHKNNKGLKSNVKKGNCSRLKETCKNSQNAEMKSKKEILEVAERRNEITLKNNLNHSYCDWNKKSAFVLSEVNNEIEIIEEFLIPNSLPKSENSNTNVKNFLQDHKKQLLDSSKSAQARELEEREYDSREDSEDDKKTVIFEGESFKDADQEVFEIDEKEVEWASRKLTNKEITNRKKSRLIKFKRKSIVGRNSAVRKSEIKLVEICSPKKEANNVEAPLEGVSENFLKEVCYLVKRLHELHKIILQQKSFFKELPNRDELFIHFSKVINAQQESFQREIRKSQKIIIKCYENMLFYQKPSEVALEISKRTSLNVDEVIYVLSQCFIVEGACEMEKSKNCVSEKGIYYSQKASSNSESPHKLNNENLMKISKKIQKTICSVPLSHPYLSSEMNKELVQRLINEPIMSCRLPVRGNSASNFQSSSDGVIKGHLLSTECQRERVEFEKFKSYCAPKNCTQKPHSQILIKDYRMGQFQHGLSQINSNLAMRHPFPDSGNTRREIYGYALSNQSVRSLSNVGQLQCSTIPSDSFTPVKNNEFPIHVQILNHTPEKPPANPLSQSNSEISRVSSKNPVVSTNVENFPGFNASSHQSNFLNNTFPLRTCNKMANAQRQVFLTSPDATRCSLEIIFTDSVKRTHLPNGLFLNPQKMTKKHCSINSSGTALGNASGRVLEEKVLDPTVPLKLTMKNRRLQAEPITGFQIEMKRSEINDMVDLKLSLEEEKNDYDRLSKSDQDSKSRVYICARNDCKKPGTRICKGCQSIIYCSETCQLRHWTPKHKAECYQLKELRG